MFAGSAKSHEKPARVTSATPVMVIQWLVSRTMRGCFCGSGILLFSILALVLGVQVGDQVGHVRPFKARPCDAFGFHLIEHSWAMMPEDGDDRGRIKRASRAGELGRSARR